MKYHLILVSVLFISLSSYSQDTIPKPGMLTFFLDCHECDFNFVREELPFVAFVRQPGMADVHILVSSSRTGSGGERFFFNFIGLNNLKDVNYEYEVTTSQSDTDDDVRRSLLKTIKLGVLSYYSKTSFFNDLDIEIEESGNRKAESMVVDRWNNWVIRLGAGAFFEKEESQNEYSINSDISAGKITEEWKTEIQAFYRTDVETFFDEGEAIRDQQDSRGIDASVIRSLGEKWSAGLFGSYQSMTFMNIKHNILGGTGIQYNFFPWQECNRRIFSMGYVIGLDNFEYNEETIYDKMKESHLAEMVMVELELIQPWGEISLGVEGRHYFYDFSKNKLSMEADLSVRLTKNLSVFCDIESQLIHDQLYLPKGDASIEDILLRRRKLATTYQIDGRLGLRFTFGSIFNNVVNERFRMGGDNGN